VLRANRGAMRDNMPQIGVAFVSGPVAAVGSITGNTEAAALLALTSRRAFKITEVR
jgi:hypothetical protein